MTRPLIGTDPDQVPRNAFLGDLARMSSDELVTMVAAGITQKLSTTGLGAINDLRNTVFEKGVPQDIFGTGMTTGLARAGADGIGIAGFANEEYGSLIVNGQWMDSSIGPAYNRIYFRNGRMWFQAMNTATSWGAWIEVATGMTALGKSLLTAADLTSALNTLSITGLGVSADLRYNNYEKGTPNSVANKGLAMGLARGGSDGLAIPAFGTTTNQYGTLLVMAGYPDLSGGPSYNRMFLRNGRMWIQPFSTSTAWGAWSEVFTPGGILGAVSQTNKVPTGAIIERGSNSNGEYTRWADGTQICTGVSPTLRTCSTQAASGGFYFASVSDTFIFPAAFAAAPNVTPMTTGQANYFSWGANNSPSSTTNSGSLIICSGLNGAQAQIGYTATGRWFL